MEQYIIKGGHPLVGEVNKPPILCYNISWSIITEV